MMCCEALRRTSAFMWLPGWRGPGLGLKLSSSAGNFARAMQNEQVEVIKSIVPLTLKAMKYLSKIRPNPDEGDLQGVRAGIPARVHPHHHACPSLSPPSN